MPIYDYDCLACGRRIEVVHGVFAPGPTHCPNCGEGPLRKAIAAPAVHFKGSGWAKRDRRAAVTAGAPKVATDAAAASGESGDGNGAKKGDAVKDGGGASNDGDTKDTGGARDGGGAADDSSSGRATRTGDAAGDRAAARSRKTGTGTATKTD